MFMNVMWWFWGGGGAISLFNTDRQHISVWEAEWKTGYEILSVGFRDRNGVTKCKGEQALCREE